MLDILVILFLLLATIYLVIGIIYAIHILLSGRESILWFPLNVLMGPISVFSAWKKVKHTNRRLG